MKITSKQYAIALYELVENTNKKEALEMLNSFVRVLSDNNNLSMSNEIIDCFQEIWNKKKNVLEVEVKSAHKLDSSSVKYINEFLRDVTCAKSIKFSEKVDEDILGGIIIRYGDKILDNSLKTKLRDLRIKLAK